MAITLYTGNIFTSKAQTLVNTVNCVGVMGAGIALECKLRYPAMFDAYAQFCHAGQLHPGTLLLNKQADRWILHFPTKKHWKQPSTEAYLHMGLQSFVDQYPQMGIHSVAFPMLGAQHGGLSVDQSERIMLQYLSDCHDLDVSIYRYDPAAKDDLFDRFAAQMLAHDATNLAKKLGLRIDKVHALQAAVRRADIVQLNQLAKVRGIGLKTLEKAFKLAGQNSLANTQQIHLDF